MRIINLASGSKGNSTFLELNGTKILIDVGLGVSQLSQRLLDIGEKIGEIKAVCITHEHIDHIRAIKSLAVKFNMDFYVERKLADSGYLSDVKFKEGKLHKIDYNKFFIDDFEIMPFEISHDAISPVGFVVNAKNSKSKIGFITDTGIVTESAKIALTGAKIVFIESNYDENMLINGTYAYPLKMRILGKRGHLSNEQSLEFANYLYENGSKCFVLCHLSENNNLPEIAFSNYTQFFEKKGCELDKDVFVRLSYQNKCGNTITLKEDYEDGK